MRSDSDTQVIEAYKRGLKPEEIASSLGYELSAVEFVLANQSRAYQRDLRSGRINIPDEDVEEIVRGLVDMAKSAELLVLAPKVRLQAAQWVIDEATGRNVAKIKMPQVTNVNIVQIQDQIVKRNKNFARLQEEIYGKFPEGMSSGSEADGGSLQENSLREGITKKLLEEGRGFSSTSTEGGGSDASSGRNSDGRNGTSGGRNGVEIEVETVN